MISGRAFATIVCLQLLIFANGFFHVEGRKGFGGTEQDWGYANVRPYAKMFWWLYYATFDGNVYDRPLMVWLQGGPGVSSTGYGNFEELGPLDLDLKPRNFTWVQDYNILFIDSPVGSGYSYSENYIGYAKDNAQLAADLLECMRNFYVEHPKWLNVPTYVLSEGYGGKTAVEFALIWDEAQRSRNIRSNFLGIALIDPWISPIDSVLSWAPFLLQTGIIDKHQYEDIENATSATKFAVDNKLWAEATKQYTLAQKAILNAVYDVNFYNILYGTQYSSPRLPNLEPDSNEYETHDREIRLMHLMNNEVKKVLGLNATWGAQQDMVFKILSGEFMKPVIDKVQRLLDETEIAVYVAAAQLDLLVPTQGTVEWVEKIAWKNSTEWQTYPRVAFSKGGHIQGYWKPYKHFSMFWIKKSGHMMPNDNPSGFSIMIKNLSYHHRAIKPRPLFGCRSDKTTSFWNRNSLIKVYRQMKRYQRNRLAFV